MVVWDARIATLGSIWREASGSLCADPIADMICGHALSHGGPSDAVPSLSFPGDLQESASAKCTCTRDRGRVSVSLLRAFVRRACRNSRHPSRGHWLLACGCLIDVRRNPGRRPRKGAERRAQWQGASRLSHPWIHRFASAGTASCFSFSVSSATWRAWISSMSFIAGML